MRRVSGSALVGTVLALTGAAFMALFSFTSTAAAATSWQLVTSPNPGTTTNQLKAVECQAADDCWAVGKQQTSSDPAQTLIEHWGGSSWSAESNSGNVNNGATHFANELNAISCVSSADCWAVGSVLESSHYLPLWDHWDGTSWTANTFLVGVATDYEFNGVSCVDSSNCWAVGYKNSGTGRVVWIEQWDGSVWTDDPSTDAGVMNGVSCVDTSNCWAVGEDDSSNTLVEHWNGTAWSSQSSPNGASANDLLGVSCIGATNCWAVGSYFDPAPSLARNLIEHWDGGAWSVATNLAGSDNDSPQQNDNALFGVTCLSASYCWAVGNYQQSGQPLRTLIDRYDGTSWSFVPGTPNNAIGNATNNLLRGVDCADTGHCAAVGDVSLPDRTLILMFQVTAGPSPSPTPTPTSLPVPPAGLATSDGSTGGALVGPLTGLGAALVAAGALALHGARRRPD
jgi:hypothetical protein